jgi:hypothetical protein
MGSMESGGAATGMVGFFSGLFHLDAAEKSIE